MNHPVSDQGQPAAANSTEAAANSTENEDQLQGMEALLEEESLSYRTVRRGEIVEGVVVSVGRDGALVHIGGKSEGIIPVQELQGAEQAGEPVAEGDEIVAQVVQTEDAEGRAVLSLERARAERGWRWLKRVFDAGEAFDVTIQDFNKGGLIASVQGVRGFIPSSQLSGMRPDTNQEAAEDRLKQMVGEDLKVKVIELNRRRNRLILSERVATQEQRAQQRDRLLEDLEAGQIRTGRITSLANFGAFVNLGGADGLVHLSELSWERVRHPSDILKVGDEVQVYVLSVDPETKRIGLSLRRAQPEPWSMVTQKYHVGDLVTATITKLTTFGAFAKVESGVEGLIHISELDDRRITHPKEVVREGDVVTVRIVRFEPDRRRLGLSLKQAQAVQLPKPERQQHRREPNEEDHILDQYRQPSGVENRIGLDPAFAALAGLKLDDEEEASDEAKSEDEPDRG